MRIGIIGAGRMAQSVGWLTAQAGHEVMLSNSRGPASIRDLSQRIGCTAGTVHEAAEFGEVIFVAIFLQDYHVVPKPPWLRKP